ncbi:GntR family transcriptional regulator [Jannaschia sp. CCS1]|uniref:GntR family transcriptional regulator n=1 Tax=Jannaschia sp. (strain CCS1) TaxID=290400 RepID=UPI000053AA97|nr:GntR family transcriptional regulator [Jannaschia sp. CCS1]ABD55024.1 transcriptional regulator, GntR family [Jannaschia sp. CCS1]
MLSTGHPKDQGEIAKPVRLSSLSSYEGTLSGRVYHSLKDAILSLAYQPGQILRKGDICDQLGISRSPVSEAVTRLATEGLVDVVPQAGTFVARFSMDEIREGAFLREALELAAIERVAGTITDEQIILLKRNLRVQEALVEDGDFQGFYKMDADMHEMILGFTGYRRLAQMAETSWLQVNRARQLILPNPGRVADTLEEHRSIIAALAARDSGAARLATQNHLRQLLRYLEPLERDHPEMFAPR